MSLGLRLKATGHHRVVTSLWRRAGRTRVCAHGRTATVASVTSELRIHPGHQRRHGQGRWSPATEILASVLVRMDTVASVNCPWQFRLPVRVHLPAIVAPPVALAPTAAPHGSKCKGMLPALTLVASALAPNAAVSTATAVVATVAVPPPSATAAVAAALKVPHGRLEAILAGWNHCGKIYRNIYRSAHCMTPRISTRLSGQRPRGMDGGRLRYLRRRIRVWFRVAIYLSAF
jgi:hypothetical protein